MSSRWIVNASPLILLGKIGHLSLLSQLTEEVVIPDVVIREIGAKPGGEDLLAAIAALSDARIKAEIPVAPDLLVWNLGRGESQVIGLAETIPGCRAVLDDLAARRCAQARRVSLIGTLGIVLRAKRRGLIPSARPVIEQLLRVGLYASDALVERALLHLGE
jgi:predicted nucleic acid-binding protein